MHKRNKMKKKGNATSAWTEKSVGWAVPSTPVQRQGSTVFIKLSDCHSKTGAMPPTYIHPPVQAASCSTSCLTSRILSRTVGFLQ